MKLLIVHYHLRPGGIRRIVELATPYLVKESPRPITRVVLATGEAAESGWHERFMESLPEVNVEMVTEPSFRYISEQRGNKRYIAVQIHQAVKKLLQHENAETCVAWAHNLGVGRNLLLSRELEMLCAAQQIPLAAHHHDWWFDNRWMRWPEMRRCGFRTLASTAGTIFQANRSILHAAINHTDATVLSRHLGKRSIWLPNLTERSRSVPAARLRETRQWLERRLNAKGTSVWILPCRSLRRKNIAEALLLTRWLRPEAWLVVTGAASSADELPYFRSLETAARDHRWRVRLGILGGKERALPTVGDLLAASEAVLLTSIQEGFGLPYIEAAAANRPLIARRLPNISPDLDRFGFRFPQAYDDIQIAPELFNWKAERERQRRLFRRWLEAMPRTARRFPGEPPILTNEVQCNIPFSRLTLTAQLEVLRHPASESWQACQPLNFFLKSWQERLVSGKLRTTSWPRTAQQWLGGSEYARRFWTAFRARGKSHAFFSSPQAIQNDFIRMKLSAENLYPLLWSTRT